MPTSYVLPPWLSTDNGSSYGAAIMQGQQMKRQKQQQAFEQDFKTKELSIEQGEWAEKQKQYQAQAEQSAKRYAAQQSLNKAIEAASKLPPGSPERTQAVNGAYLQYGLEAGVGSAALGAALRGSMPQKPNPSLQFQKATMPRAQTNAAPSPTIEAGLSRIYGPPTTTAAAPQPGIWTFGNRVLKQSEMMPPAGPAQAPQSVQAIPVIENGKVLDDQFGVFNGKSVTIHNKPKPGASTEGKLSMQQQAQLRDLRDKKKILEKISDDDAAIVLKAKALGKKPQEVADSYAAQLKAIDGQIKVIEGTGEKPVTPAEGATKRFKWDNGNLVPIP